jgi:hypothetical protein
MNNILNHFYSRNNAKHTKSFDISQHNYHHNLNLENKIKINEFRNELNQKLNDLSKTKFPDMNYNKIKNSFQESVYKNFFSSCNVSSGVNSNLINKNINEADYLPLLEISPPTTLNLKNNQASDDDYKSVISNKQSNLNQSIVNNISDSLDQFKIDMFSVLLKVQKNQKKIKIGDLREELDDFKTRFQKKFEIVEKSRIETMESLYTELHKIKEEIHKTIQKDSLCPRPEYNKFKSQVNSFKDEMNKKINSIEKTQNLHFNQVRVLMENSSDQKLRSLSSKFQEIDDSLNQTKKSFQKPAKIVLNEIVNDLKLKRLVTNKKNNRRDTSLLDRDTANFISEKKKKILNYEEKISEKPQELQNFIKLENSSNSLTPYFNADHSYNSSKINKRKTLQRLQSLTRGKAEDLNYMKPKKKISIIGKFRTYVYAVIACSRLNKIREEKNIEFEIEFLNNFEEHSNYCENAIKNWMIKCSKNVIASIYSFPNLSMDVSNQGPYKNNSAARKETFVKLGIRLKSFIESFNESLSNNKFSDFKIVTFLRMIISENQNIPLNIFTLFELSRLEYKHCKFINLIKIQKLMILSFYVLVKIFIQNILLNESKLATNKNLKLNYKLIASIYFHTIVQYFKSECIVKNKINNKKDLINNQMRERKNKQSQQILIRLNSFKNYSTSNNEKYYILDEDQNDIQYISKELYNLEDLGSFFDYLNSSGFNFTEEIKFFLERLLFICEN